MIKRFFQELTIFFFFSSDHCLIVKEQCNAWLVYFKYCGRSAISLLLEAEKRRVIPALGCHRVSWSKVWQDVCLALSTIQHSSCLWALRFCWNILAVLLSPLKYWKSAASDCVMYQLPGLLILILQYSIVFGMSPTVEISKLIWGSGAAGSQGGRGLCCSCFPLWECPLLAG